MVSLALKFRSKIIFAGFVFFTCTCLILAQEAAQESGTDWKEKAQGALDATADGAKVVGGVIADGAKTGYVAVKDSFTGSVNYFKNNTAGEVVEDVQEGAAKVGSKIATGATKAWNSFTGLFN